MELETIEVKMKKVKHEPEVSKEDPEKIARRKRAKLRRLRRAAESDDPGATEQLRRYNKETIDASKGSDAERGAKLVSGRRHSPPIEREGAVPVREEAKAGRMKTVISQDNILMMLVDADPSEVKIQFCHNHYDALLAKLKLHGIDHLITSNVQSLKARLAAKGIDPLWHAQEALIRVAINTVGSEGVVQHRCPVCALQKFDFLAQIALAMKQACVRKSS
jgi:hypothetical protein